MQLINTRLKIFIQGDTIGQFMKYKKLNSVFGIDKVTKKFLIYIITELSTLGNKPIKGVAIVIRKSVIIFPIYDNACVNKSLIIRPRGMFYMR